MDQEKEVKRVKVFYKESKMIGYQIEGKEFTKRGHLVEICHRNNKEVDYLVGVNMEQGKEVLEDDQGYLYIEIFRPEYRVRSEFGDGWASAWTEPV